MFGWEREDTIWFELYVRWRSRTEIGAWGKWSRCCDGGHPPAGLRGRSGMDLSSTTARRVGTGVTESHEYIQAIISTWRHRLPLDRDRGMEGEGGRERGGEREKEGEGGRERKRQNFNLRSLIIVLQA